MKTLASVVIALALFLLPGCKETRYGIGTPTDPTPSWGSIGGEFYLDPSVQGSVTNVLVSMYSSEDDFRAGRKCFVAWTNAQGQYLIERICCGKYWIDALKDNDGNAVISSGDYYLIYRDTDGCPCPYAIEQCAATFGGKLEVVR